MPLISEKTAISTLEVTLKQSAEHPFIDWQAHFYTQIAKTSGLISFECLIPTAQPNTRVIIQRFASPERALAWQQSPEYTQLIQELASLSVGQIKKIEGSQSLTQGNITELILTEVSSGMEENFRAWSAKIHQIEARFPGFRGLYLQSPMGNGKHWITLLQFDCMENLDRWLQSQEREKLLQESHPFISAWESHRVISPYAGWFASIAKIGELPSVFKQTMLVLLVLFPIVMLELKFLLPLLMELNPSVRTFIGNALSVTLIAFPMMPITIWLLGWWLTTHRLKINLLGTLLVGLLYLIEIVLFWNFL